MSQQCPFLSTVEETVACFKECALYEYESSADGCPFKKVKGHKSLSIKEILSLDIESTEDDAFESEEFEEKDDFFDNVFIKEFL